MLGSSKRDREDTIIKKEEQKKREKVKAKQELHQRKRKKKNKPKNAIFSKTHVGLNNLP
jgi:hypothetical protein